MPHLDQMSERELLAELHHVAAECERLNFKLSHVVQQQRFCTYCPDAATTTQNERALLSEMNRLMDRRRAIEGHLMRTRGQLRPLRQDE